MSLIRHRSVLPSGSWPCIVRVVALSVYSYLTSMVEGEASIAIIA
jgi:hypothetical protein